MLNVRARTRGLVALTILNGYLVPSVGMQYHEVPRAMHRVYAGCPGKMSKLNDKTECRKGRLYETVSIPLLNELSAREERRRRVRTHLYPMERQREMLVYATLRAIQLITTAIGASNYAALVDAVARA